MHGLQKCTLPTFIGAVRLLQTGWFQNQQTSSSVQTGPVLQSQQPPLSGGTVSCTTQFCGGFTQNWQSGGAVQSTVTRPEKNGRTKGGWMNTFCVFLSPFRFTFGCSAARGGCEEVQWSTGWQKALSSNSSGDISSPCILTSALAAFRFWPTKWKCWHIISPPVFQTSVSKRFRRFIYHMWFPVCFLYVYCWAVGVMMPPVHGCKYERWEMKESRVLCTGQQQQQAERRSLTAFVVGFVSTSRAWMLISVYILF